MNSSVATSGYTQTLASAGLYTLHGAGLLKISGEDQEGFLQRQTTNDIRLLKPAIAQLSVLTSPVGRILDVLYILKEQTNASQNDIFPEITLLSLPGNNESTYQFLKSRIFFMDRVSIVNHSQEFSQVDLFGPRSNEIIEQVLAIPAPDANQVVFASFANEPLKLIAHSPAIGLGYRLIVNKNLETTLLEALVDLEVANLESDTYELLRIEAGIPGAGAELSEAYTPLETGLISAISQSKGCYTGQEVIARQINYDKVTQSICGVSLEKFAEIGSIILADNSPVGKLTSIASSPRFGIIGLAIIKRPHHQPGQELTIGADPIKVHNLPFTD